MGRCLYTRVGRVGAVELALRLGGVRVSAADTSKVPNPSATAASSGTDLNGKAAQAAARTIKARLAEFAGGRHGVAPATVRFEAGYVCAGDQRVRFAELVQQAYLARASLSAADLYRTPKLHW